MNRLFRFSGLRRPVDREPLNDPFSVTLAADREVRVTGFRCVLCYEEQAVRLRVAGGILTVTGTGLFLKTFYPGELRIVGCIRSIAVERGDKK